MIEQISFHVDCRHANRARVILCHSDGTAERREVDCRSLQDALGNSLRTTTPSWCSVGCLPEGYINAVIGGADLQTFRVALGFPGKERVVRHYEKLCMMPMPRTLMFIEARGGRFTNMWIYAVRSDGVICNFPTPNVYREGSVCWGSNERIAIESIQDCDKAVSIFFDSAFNHDLYSSDERRFKSFSEELVELKGMKSFPDEWLVPAGAKEVKLTENDILGKPGFVLSFLTKELNKI